MEPPAPVTMTDLPAMLRDNRLVIGRNRVAPQQVLGLHRSQIADRDATGRDVLHGRQGAHANLYLRELLQCRLPIAAERPGHGQQHLIHLEPLNEAGQSLGRNHTQTGDILAGQRPPRVDERDGPIAAGRLQCLEQLYAGGAGPIDEDSPIATG